MRFSQHIVCYFCNIFMRAFNSIAGSHQILIPFFANLNSILNIFNIFSLMLRFRYQYYSPILIIILHFNNAPSGMILELATNRVCPNSGSTFCSALLISSFFMLVLYLNLSFGNSFSNCSFTLCEILLIAISCNFASSPKIPTTPFDSLC